MVPELTISVLACARIGAVHSVVFAGFSAHSLANRINDATCTMVLTSDGSFRGPKEIPIKPIVDESLLTCPSVKSVIVLKRTGAEVHMKSGRDIWWHDALKEVTIDCPAETMDSAHVQGNLVTAPAWPAHPAWMRAFLQLHAEIGMHQFVQAKGPDSQQTGGQHGIEHVLRHEAPLRYSFQSNSSA